MGDLLQALLKEVPYGQTLVVPLLLALTLVLGAMRDLRGMVETVAGFFALFLGGTEERRRRDQRRHFTRLLHDELARILKLSDWTDDRFAQLEAELEVEARRALWRRMLRPWAPVTTVRRERSLSTALRKRRDRLIVLEGDPGAGKSVAMRRVASEVLRQALRGLQVNPVLPIYVNLRDLNRVAGAEIDGALIRDFVWRTVNRSRNSAAKAYLDAHLDEEIAKGRLLFLFDSFDEIPDVLASTSADEVVTRYADAIRDFSQTFSSCRTIIASREYRGPRSLAATRFRVLRLSLERQQTLVRRFELPTATTRMIEAYLGEPPATMRSLLENPMFLSLVCRRVQRQGTLPESPREVFTSYLQARLDEFKDELRPMLGNDHDRLLTFAREVAFEMAVNPSFGLSPEHAELIAALDTRGVLTRAGLDVARAAKLLDALELVKIGRPGDDPNDRSFTFVHRRFQEFFAAELLVENPSLVDTRQLVVNGIWREAAVALLQTQDAAGSALLLAQIGELLRHQLDLIAATPVRSFRFPMPWTSTTLHVLGILDAAFPGHPESIPEPVMVEVMAIASRASERGTLVDLKWVLDSGSFLPPGALATILPRGEDLDVDILRDTVLRVLGKLPRLEPEITSWLHRTLVLMVADGSMRQRRWTVRNQLARLKEPIPFLETLRLATVARSIEGAFWIGTFVVLIGTTLYALKIDTSLWQKSDAAVKACCGAVCGSLDKEACSAKCGSADVEYKCANEILDRGKKWSDATVRFVFGMLAIFVGSFVSLIGYRRRGALIASRPTSFRVIWMIQMGLIVASNPDQDFPLAVVATMLCGCWLEGAAWILRHQRRSSLWTWPSYFALILFAWYEPGWRMLRKVYGALIRSPAISGEAVQVPIFAWWIGSYVVVSMAAVFSGVAWAFVLLAAFMLGTLVIGCLWLLAKAVGYCIDFVHVARVLPQARPGTLSIDAFIVHMMSLHSARMVSAFVEAVERDQLLNRTPEAARTLGIVQGLLQEDRRRLRQSVTTSRASATLLQRVLAAVVVYLALDKSFGLPSEVLVRIGYRALERRDYWSGRFVSAYRDVRDELPAGFSSAQPWRLAACIGQAGPALVRLSEQMR